MYRIKLWGQYNMKNKQIFSKLLLLGLSVAVMLSFVTVVLLRPRTEAQRHGRRRLTTNRHEQVSDTVAVRC
jgi:hypothetical protein